METYNALNARQHAERQAATAAYESHRLESHAAITALEDQIRELRRQQDARRLLLSAALRDIKARHAQERADWYRQNADHKAAQPKRPVGRPRKQPETDEYGRTIEYRDGERRIIQ